MEEVEQNQQEMQEKFMMFQTLHKQIEQIQQHIEMMNQQKMELDISVTALKTLGETAAGTEILAPIANGIFMKAKVTDNQKLVVNVGSNVTTEKTVEQVVGLLEEQDSKINEKIVEASQLLEQMQEQAMDVFKQVEAAQGE
jgi:prefoldin alpha subunit